MLQKDLPVENRSFREPRDTGLFVIFLPKLFLSSLRSIAASGNQDRPEPVVELNDAIVVGVTGAYNWILKGRALNGSLSRLVILLILQSSGTALTALPLSTRTLGQLRLGRTQGLGLSILPSAGLGLSSDLRLLWASLRGALENWFGLGSRAFPGFGSTPTSGFFLGGSFLFSSLEWTGWFGFGSSLTPATRRLGLGSCP